MTTGLTLRLLGAVWSKFRKPLRLEFNRDTPGALVFGFFAALVILTLFAVYVFVGSQAFNTFSQSHISAGTFFGTKIWDGEQNFGTLVFTVGSLSLMVCTLIFAVPLSVATALFITELAPPWLGTLLRNIVELLLGIPSVIFGLIGLLVIVPQVSNLLGFADYSGQGIVAAVIVITFMIVPTITTIAVDALRTVPRDLREGALALGATRWQMITRSLVPAAGPGILTGVILGAARVLGETVAVELVIGGAIQFPFTITSFPPYYTIGPTSTLTLALLDNFKEALPGETVYNAIWTISFYLLIISAIFVGLSRFVTSRRAYR